jgi:hypothetical protein
MLTLELLGRAGRAQKTRGAGALDETGSGGGEYAGEVESESASHPSIGNVGVRFAY